MRVKTNELTGAPLDWAVAKCEGEEVRLIKGQLETLWTDNGYKPSTDWSQGGPIIEREELSRLRCYVASKLGEEITVPEAYLETSN